MKVRERFDLTYCSNIHAGETWAEVSAALDGALPEIRRALAFDGPMAIGLRLSAQAAGELEQPDRLDAFRAFLRDGRYYVPTINGFPYGAFHGERVKERVYLPDWRDPARLTYTNRLSSLLAVLLADAGLGEGSVSTVPGAFKRDVKSQDDERAIAYHVLDHAAHLVALHQRTGVVVALAIEPEPACFIETTTEAVDFFTRYLFDPATLASWGAARGLALRVDEVRRHVGLCFDTCHMAVEFEHASVALERLDAAGIRVPKFQISSAIRVSRPAAGSPARQALAKFADDTYLHQVVEERDGALTRYVDLPEALQSPSANADEWRVHFHVPVFLESMGALGTTQRDLVGVLDLIKQRRAGACLEVETYTWDVLPPEYKQLDMNAAIARELAWTRDRLDA
jgi:sugar phosphate isomerase/epimerase